MIEDPELTRKILEYFAQDSVPYPANVTFDDLCAVFNKEDPERISYHLLCAAKTNLLEVPYKETHTGDGVLLTFDYISGLTPEGGEYVQHSRTSLWDKAIHQVKESGVAVTTAILVNYLPKLANKMLGI